MNNNSKAPTAKMTSVGASGAVMILIVWLAGQFGLEVPAEVASALTVVVAWLAGYATDDTAGKVAKVLGKLWGDFQEAAQDDDVEDGQ